MNITEVSKECESNRNILPVRHHVCSGGTIPLLQAWMQDGMSMGSAAAFMLTGPAIKITNLVAVKIVLVPSDLRSISPTSCFLYL